MRLKAVPKGEKRIQLVDAFSFRIYCVWGASLVPKRPNCWIFDLNNPTWLYDDNLISMTNCASTLKPKFVSVYTHSWYLLDFFNCLWWWLLVMWIQTTVQLTCRNQMPLLLLLKLLNRQMPWILSSFNTWLIALWRYVFFLLVYKLFKLSLNFRFLWLFVPTEKP